MRNRVTRGLAVGNMIAALACTTVCGADFTPGDYLVTGTPDQISQIKAEGGSAQVALKDLVADRDLHRLPNSLYASPKRAVITTNNVNLRSGSSTEYDVLKQLSTNEEVTVLGKGADSAYSYVEYQGTRGFVISTGLQEGEELPDETDSCFVSINSSDELEALLETGVTAVPAEDKSIALDEIAEGRNLEQIPYVLEDARERYVNITSGYLAFRTGPSTGYEMLDKLDRGEKVLELGTNEAGDWSFVSFEGVTGYVSNQYLSDTDPNGAPQPDVMLEEPKTMYVATTGKLNFRAGPNLGAAVVSRLSRGTPVTVKGVSADAEWMLIDRDGQTGYVFKEYLSDTKPAALREAEEKQKSSSSEEEEDTSAEEASGSGLVNMGTFKLTYYCNCSRCCGEWAGGPTAIGTYPSSGYTIAVDPDVIPLGSTVYINGNEYRAEDTGSSIVGNRIDVYMDDHEAALDAGVSYATVYLAR